MSRGLRWCGLVLLVPSILAGQSAQGGTGPWILGALGGGIAQVRCTQCSAGSDAGTVIGLGAGLGLTPRVQLGLTLDGWVRPLTGSRTHQAFLDLTVAYAPVAGSGLYVAVGGGISRYVRRTSRDGGRRVSSALGPALKLQVGQDLGLTRELLLVPAVTLLHGVTADEKVDGAATGFRLRRDVLHLSLGLRWLIARH